MRHLLYEGGDSKKKRDCVSVKMSSVKEKGFDFYALCAAATYCNMSLHP